VKKVWGIVLVLVMVCGTGIATLFLSSNNTLGVKANSDPAFNGLNIQYRDNNMYQGTRRQVNLAGNRASYKLARPAHPGQSLGANVDVISLANYEGFGTHCDVTWNPRLGVMEGTRATFIIDVPAGHSRTNYAYNWRVNRNKADVDPAEEETVIETRSHNMWLNIEYVPYANVGTATDGVGTFSQWRYTSMVQSSRTTWMNVSDNATVSGNTVIYSFTSPGVYYFTIRHEDITTTYDTEFAMIVRRQPPSFRAHFPQNVIPSHSRNTLTMLSNNIVDKDEFYAEFRQPLTQGGFRVENQARFKINKINPSNDEAIGLSGLPNFLEYRGHVGRNDPLMNNAYPRLTFGKAANKDLVNGVYGTGGLGIISFTVLYPSYERIDAVTGLAIPASAGGAWLDPSNSEYWLTAEVLEMTLTLRDQDRGPGFPYWVLFGGIAIILVLMGTWWATNRFSLFVQVRDIKKRRKKEEVDDMARMDNLEKMRQETDSQTPPK